MPKLSAGHDLKPGILGVSLNSRDIYSKPAIIVNCRANSPAAKAGFQAGDQIIEIDGKPVQRQAQLRERINRHYAGETLHVVVLRGTERIERDVALIDSLEPYARPFLGLLPMRGTAPATGGVTVRYVYPDSPAANSGLRPGDIIVSLNDAATSTREALAERTSALKVGTSAKARRAAGRRNAFARAYAGDRAGVRAGIASHCARPPADDVAVAEGRPQVGPFAVKLPEFKNDCQAYVPEAYNGNASYGLVVWLHPPGGTTDEELLAQWREPCEAQNLILLAPRTVDPARWMPPEVEFVAKAIGEIREHYNIDPQRIVVHGQQAGGSLAYMVAFLHRDVVRGVAAVDAPFLGRVPENDPANRLTLFTTTAKKANFAEQITSSIEQLRKLKYAVTVIDEGDTARYLNADEFAELLRWIDSLDKI